MPKSPATLRQVWGTFTCAVFVALASIGIVLFYQHRADPDIQTVAVRVVLDSLPFLASILFALWPQVSRAHIGFRVVIIIVGVLWSGLQGRKDYLDIQQARKDQQAAIITAVAAANKHSDDQMQNLRNDLDNKLGDLGKSVTQGFSGLKPPPPEFAALEFKFFDSPGNALNMHGGSDRVFSIDFTATAITEKTFDNGDVWVEICQACKFAKEPIGFDKPNGIAETSRHRPFNRLNPGVSMDKMTIEVIPPKGANYFEIAWRYSCETCGKQRDPQKFTINVLPQYKLPSIKLN